LAKEPLRRGASRGKIALTFTHTAKSRHTSSSFSKIDNLPNHVSLSKLCM
jgi:hypothetical protein